MAKAPLFGNGSTPVSTNLPAQAAPASGAAPKATPGSKPQAPTGRQFGAAGAGKPSSPYKGAGPAPKGGRMAPPTAKPMKKSGRGC